MREISGARPRRRSISGEAGLRLGVSLARALLLIALFAGSALLLRVNAVSAGFVLLIAVLLVASREPLPVATIAAVCATLTYNYFFFPPKHTLVINDPENWVALVTFLLASLLANRLLVRERRQSDIVRSSRKDIEALYDLSVSLLKEGTEIGQVGIAAAKYLDTIGAASGGIIRFGASPQQQEVLVWTGAPASEEVEEIAAGAGRHGRVTSIPSRFGRDVCLPLVVSGRVAAVLMSRGPERSLGTLESAATILSFALDRERFMKERARLDALHETNELKTSLLQAVSHDLKSPLTVLSVESEALERTGISPDYAAAHVRTIRDEVARLHRRIDNLLSVARFEAGIVSPHPEPTPPADLFRTARESLPTVTAVRRIETKVDEDTPDLWVDPSLALEIVVNLIENAHRAMRPGEVIELSASTSSDLAGRVWIEVRDRGAGLPEDQNRMLRRIEASDTTRGIGIALSRTLASLSGGSVEWFARQGGGTVARLDLPAVAQSSVEVS